jgi:hypothetical protein
VRIQGLRIDHDLILKQGHVHCPPEGTPMPNITVGQENKADPEIRDDARVSVQPVMANRAGGTKIPPPTVPRADPKVVNGGGRAARTGPSSIPNST